MKKSLCIFIAACCCTAVCHAQMRAMTDERIELTSIVFRLAGMHEFVNDDVYAYTRTIDEYFEGYREHELIQYVRQLREEQRIAYAAAAGSATKLRITENGVALHPGLTYADAAQDRRWTEETFARYVALLDDFYRTSGFRAFFEANEALYAAAAGEMDALLSEIDTRWFPSFFGEEFVAPNVYAAMANGRNNYIVEDPSSAAGYGIVIGCTGNGSGMPQLSDSVLPTIVHEICHFYTEPLFQTYWKAMEPAADTLYPSIREQMRRNAYGSAQETTVEWLNNLFKIMYFKENPNSRHPARFLVTLDAERGFIWMQRAFLFMDNFYRNRDTYAYIGDYMPRIVDFLNHTVADLETVLQEYNARNPYIIEVYPAPGDLSDVADSFDEVRITFSVPMGTHAYAYNNIKDSEYPILPVRAAYWEDARTFVLKIDSRNFEPGRTYGVRLNRYYFVDQWNHPLRESVDYLYTTALPNGDTEKGA